MRRLTTRCTAVLAFGVLSGWSHAEPIIPASAGQVIEVLPVSAGNAEARRLRKLLAARPADTRLALMLARRQLEQARMNGDPRFAGQALATLGRWSDAAGAPSEVLLLRAELQQFLHEFDTAKDTLHRLLARPNAGANAQAWLMLATVLRVQGRYVESDAACTAVRASGAELYAAACLAENAGLRGDVARAAQTFKELLAESGISAATRAWLWTSLAELDARDGRDGSADQAFSSALGWSRDGYAAVAYADFLIDRRQPKKALAVLKDQARTDAVLLRLAIAGAQAHAADAARDAAELRERIALANARPGAEIYHGREQAMFALSVERMPQRALALARGNVAHQREAIDLLVMARAAAAANDPIAKTEVQSLRKTMGLHDRRLDGLL